MKIINKTELPKSLVEDSFALGEEFLETMGRNVLTLYEQVSAIEIGLILQGVKVRAPTVTTTKFFQAKKDGYLVNSEGKNVVINP